MAEILATIILSWWGIVLFIGIVVVILIFFGRHQIYICQCGYVGRLTDDNLQKCKGCKQFLKLVDKRIAVGRLTVFGVWKIYND